MSRPRLGNGPSVPKVFRVPEDVSDRFAKACRGLDKTQSEIMLKLLVRWLRQVEGINKLKEEPK